MILEECITAFVRDTCAGKNNETPSAYRSKLRHLEKYLGSDRAYINQVDIDQFKIYLLERKTKNRGKKLIKGELSRFTIRTILATTRHFLKWLYLNGYLQQEIRLKNIIEPRPDPKAINQKTFEQLVTASKITGAEWERARNFAILYMLRDTGGRVGSLARLELECIDLDNGYATVPDKGDQLSWLWFNPPTSAAIRAWLQYRDQLNPSDSRLFTGTRGSGLTRQGIYRVLRKLASTAKIKGRYNPHSFRHAFARDSILAGADLGIVADLMNHSNVVVTQKYYARWKRKELKKFHKRYSPGRMLPE